MKKVIINIVLILIFFLGKAQTYPIQQNLGGPTTLVKNPNYGGIQGSLIPFSFADTTAANTALTYAKNYGGTLIYTTDIQAVWFRDITNTRWTQLLPSGGATGTRAWTQGGDNVQSVDPDSAQLGPTNSRTLFFITNDTKRFALKYDGIQAAAGTVKPLGRDSVTGMLSYYTDAGGTTPTWQQTLTAGSVLSSPVSITGAVTYTMTDFTSFNLIKSGDTRFQITAGVTALRTSGSASLIQQVAGTTSISAASLLTTAASDGNHLTEIHYSPDTLQLRPSLGNLYIDTLNNETSQNTLMGWTTTSGTNRGKVGYITLSGLSIAAGVLSVNSGAGMVYPGAGIPNSTGSAWGTSYSTTGSGAVVALQTSPSFVTSVIGGASFDVFNTTSTTINAFGAATAMTIGGTPTTAITHNYSTNATATATTKTINFGTGGAASSTTNINIGDADGGTTTINSPTLAIATAATIGGITVPTISSTNTLTNKRWTARVGSTTSSATPTINTDNTDIYKLTAQTADITSMTSNLSGTPVDGDILEIQITGTAARAITWGASFVSSTVTLPATTVTTATLTVILQYYTTSSYGNNKWVCTNYY